LRALPPPGMCEADARAVSGRSQGESEHCPLPLRSALTSPHDKRRRLVRRRELIHGRPIEKSEADRITWPCEDILRPPLLEAVSGRDQRMNGGDRSGHSDEMFNVRHRDSSQRRTSHIFMLEGEYMVEAQGLSRGSGWPLTPQEDFETHQDLRPASTILV